ncbi:unknown [Prevotella sp. CAG:1185]|nr:unknown [Prevotella sp. CAG:1185]
MQKACFWRNLPTSPLMIIERIKNFSKNSSLVTKPLNILDIKQL